MRTSAGTFWKAGLMMEMSSGRSCSLAISILMLEAMVVRVSSNYFQYLLDEKLLSPEASEPGIDSC